MTNGRAAHPSTTTVATALAHGFLTTHDWRASALTTIGTTVLGSRRRWLPAVVRAVLVEHPHPPLDAPRMLAATILAVAPFADAAARQVDRGRPYRVATHLVAPDTAVPRTPVARLDTTADLARLLDLSIGDLDWFADAGGWNRRANPRLQHYRHEWRARPGRTPRLLEVPGRRLREHQRVVLEQIVGRIPTHHAAHGFVPGRSAITGAAAHLGSHVVISLDLASFFTRVEAGRVWSQLRVAGLTESVARTVAGLCTHAVPPAVISAMPPGGSPEERHRLRLALARAHLPQGAPTSPALANVSVARLDRRLQGLADAAGARYTRYADDLTFSGDHTVARRADSLVRAVTMIVREEGHLLNERKTRIRTASTRQTVTGVVVNRVPNIPRAEFDALKATIHNCVRWGPESQNRHGHPEFRAHLLGRIGWVTQLNPARGAALRADFDSISWH